MNTEVKRYEYYRDLADDTEITVTFYCDGHGVIHKRLSASLQRTSEGHVAIPPRTITLDEVPRTARFIGSYKV